jgi:adenosine deaminase
VRILELRYAPSFLLEKHTHLQADRMHAAIERGVRRAEAAYPIAVGLICILQRTRSAAENASWTDFALEHRGSFVGLDLADDEVAFAPEPFLPHFERARAAGLGVTVHAGEPAVPGIARNVRYAVEAMGARRIGHGLQAIADPAVVELLASTGTVLELCLTSNILTGAAEDFPSHPLRRLYEAGVRVTLNTDDPGIMDTDMNREYALAAAHHGFRAAEFGRCAAWAAEVSFVPEERKREVWPA